MKIRTDFVTNSSSSSFILGFKDKTDGFAKIGALAARAEEFEDTWSGDATETFLKAIGELLVDFSNATPLDKEAIAWRYGDEIKWEARYLTHVYRFGDEDKEDLKRLEDKEKELMDKLEKDLLAEPYCVELEYEDHTDTGCLLEQDLLPDWEYTIKRFSHH